MANRSIAPNDTGRMSVAEAAEYLDAHPETVRKWIREGKIPAARIGQLGNYILYEDDLAKLLATNPPTEDNKE